LIVVCAGKVSSKLREDIKAHAKAIGIAQTEVWSGYELEENIRQKDESILYRFFSGLPFFRSGSSTQPNTVLERYQKYQEIYIGCYAHITNNFVDLRCVVDGKVVSASNIDWANIGNDTLVLGESGYGKTMLVKKVSVQHVAEGGISLVLDAKYYEKGWTEYLNTHVAKYGFANTEEFLTLCQETGRQLLLIIDGANECSQENLNNLLTHIRYISNSTPVRKIITSQPYKRETNSNQLSTIIIQRPDDKAKYEVASKYSDAHVLPRLQSILKGVNTCFEARVIGQLGAKGIDKSGRYELIELFVRERLSDAALRCMKLLSAIAKNLSSKITFSLSLFDAEKLLEQNGCGSDSIHLCLTSGILSKNSTKISFSHEMFYNFFRANEILRNWENKEYLASTLSDPQNQDITSLILSGIPDLVTSHKIFDSVIDDNVLYIMTTGELGHYAKTWIDNRIDYIKREILDDVMNVKFHLTDKDMSHYPYTITPNRITDGPKQDRSLVIVFTQLLSEGEYLAEMLEIIRHMDLAIANQQSIIYNDLRKKGKTKRVSLFSYVYGRKFEESCSFGLIFDILSSQFSYSNNISLEELICYTAECSLTAGQLYFLLLICDPRHRTKVFYPIVLEILKHHWKNTPYLLRTCILDRVYMMQDSEEKRIELISAIQEIHAKTTDVWESTNIFEALSNLEAFDEESVNYTEGVRVEIQSLLSDPNNSNSWKEANNLYACQFDHPFSSAFSAAISNLTTNNAKIFYLMALRSEGTDIFTKSLISKAVEVAGAECCPYLYKWMTDPFHDKFMPSESLSTFISCYVICGKLNHSIDLYKNEDISSQCYLHFAEMYYWINRTDMSIQDKKAKCTMATKEISITNPYISLSCVQALHFSMIRRFPIYNFPEDTVHIYEIFPYIIAALSRSVLTIENHEKISSIFITSRDVKEFAIDFLGKHGESTDIMLLRNLAINRQYSIPAINAIKLLENRLT
jgi:hypothetical protein